MQELDALARQIDAGQLTLADLDAMSASRGTPGSGAVSTIFGTSIPQKVALEYLGSARYHGEIAKRHASDEAARLLSREYGVDISKQTSAEKQHEALARHPSLTEFAEAITGPTPSQIASLKTASEDGPRAACVSLVKEWRLH